LKEKVSPAVVAVVVVLMLAVIGFIGMKVFGGSSKAINDPSMKERYDTMTKKGLPSREEMEKAMSSRGSGNRTPGGSPRPTGSP